jgi:signal transduction histidine kinase
VQVFAESGGAMVTVAVRDEGIGMEEQVLVGLFKSDRIQSRKGTDGERGTGLGLLLCAELVQRLGGTIWVQSSPGQGTTVYFTLPRGQVTS